VNQEARARIRAIIDNHGQMLQSVHRSAGDPPNFQPFIYTIGNHERGLPELLFVCDATEGFGATVNALGELQRNRDIAFAPDEIVSLGGRFPVRILDAGAPGREEFAVQAGVFYETEDFEVRQILLCDEEGRWPGDQLCAEPFASQPVLGGSLPGTRPPRS
jgi:hypothetical protein